MGLYEHIDDYLERRIYPFHMPGHKRNKKYFPYELLDYDLTEIDGMDNLHEPSGIIAGVQERLAAIYGADESFMLTNGSTGGLLAAVLSACPDGSKAIIARNCHQSIYNGLLLARAVPVYTYPRLTRHGLAGCVDPSDIEHLLAKHNDVRAVIITSPTYEGFVSDIKAIAAITSCYNTLLIVDEAHGAHFPFHPSFPSPAITLGADIAVTSLHKTLPALSQSAALHSGGRADTDAIRQYLRMVQTSSPSYILMSAMDKILDTLRNDKRHFEIYTQALRNLRDELGGLDSIELVGRDTSNEPGVYDIDMGKLTFCIHGGMTGPEFVKTLAERHAVQLEMSGFKHAVGITSVADEAYGFERLIKGVREIAASIKPDSCAPRITPLPDADVVIPPHTAHKMSKEYRDIRLCEGQVAGAAVTLYPPGIPLLYPGERITAEIIDTLKLAEETGISITGAHEGRIQVVT